MDVIMKINPNLFCPDTQFENQIVNLLNRYLFNNSLFSLLGTATCVSNLYEIYEDMRRYCDCPDIEKKFMLDGKCVLHNINRRGLTINGFLYAGHDLPVWVNSPQAKNVDEVDCKIMIVGRDPGRKPYDMYEMDPTCDQLSIYSPFGLHCRYHRRKTQDVPCIVDGIINCASKNGKTVSIYVTDYYKLRKVDPSSVNNGNRNIYKSVYDGELSIFRPDVVILLGKSVMGAIGIPSNTPYFSIYSQNGINYMPIPHPSGSNNNEISSEKKKRGKESMRTKDFYIEEICKSLKEVCSKK